MDREHYFQFLYPFQDRVLESLREIDTDFYLTGGTASSRGYLNHRFSEDLDFFVNDDERFSLWAERVIHQLAASAAWQIEVLLREPRFVRLNLLKETGSLRLEFVNDVPTHIGEIRQHPVLGRLDSPENILANKLTALLDREEPKDLADVWGFCYRYGLSVATALEDAHGKAAGLFPADLARVLLSATRSDWELVQWIEAPESERYLAELRRTGEALLSLEENPRPPEGTR
jgi:hypothetical protein